MSGEIQFLVWPGGHIDDGIDARRACGVVRPGECIIDEKALRLRHDDGPVEALGQLDRGIEGCGSACAGVVNGPVASIESSDTAARGHPDAAIDAEHEVMHVVAWEGRVGRVVHCPVATGKARHAIVCGDPEGAARQQEVCDIVARDAGVGDGIAAQVGDDAAYIGTNAAAVDPRLILVADAISTSGAGRAHATAVDAAFILVQFAISAGFFLFAVCKKEGRHQEHEQGCVGAFHFHCIDFEDNDSKKNGQPLVQKFNHANHIPYVWTDSCLFLDILRLQICASDLIAMKLRKFLPSLLCLALPLPATLASGLYFLQCRPQVWNGLWRPR